MRFATFLSIVLTLLSGCMLRPVAVPENPAPSPQLKVDRDSYRLGTGDRIRIDVYGEPDMSIEVTLEGAGSINYPLLGRIQISGMTVKELEELIAKRLRSGYLVNPSVRANVLHFRPVYVIGQVRKAGAFPYVEGLTVEKAIALAGGMTDIASTRKIYILREGVTQNRREHAKLETPVSPGDTIVIEESLF